MSRDIARTILKRLFTSGQGALRLRRWNGKWWHHNGCYYSPVASDQMKAMLWEAIDKLKEKPSSHRVREVEEALMSVGTLVSGPMPQWLDSKERPRTQSVVAFENGLLDVDDYCKTGQIRLMEPTPMWFAASCCPYALTPTAECPHFRQFLATTFDDEATVRLVQEWIGYNLVPDTSQEKLALLIGPTRSGKSTMTGALHTVLGDGQLVTTDLTTLGARFGLSPLPGKLAAVVPDAELGRTADDKRVAEVLKNIVGRDPVSVERKYVDVDPLVYLVCRITIGTNSMPTLPDSNAAIVARLLPIVFPHSFLGSEDVGLKDRLKTEGPGIALWGLEGLRRLRARGRFLLPPGSQRELKRIGIQLAPLSAFITECCQVAPGCTVSKSELLVAQNKWAVANEAESIEDAAALTRQLGDLLPSLKTCKLGSKGSQVPHYRGIGLR